MTIFKRRGVLVARTNNVPELVIKNQLISKRLEGSGVEINLRIALTMLETCLSEERGD